MVTDYSDMAVVMTAKSRPDYLKRTLRSWAAARNSFLVRDFVLALGRSPVQSDMIDLAAETGLRVRVRLDSKQAEASPGMHRAIGEGIDAVLQDPRVNFVVLGEEDVVVSDDILEYMAWARQVMALDPQVLVAMAHNVGGNGWDAHHKLQPDGTTAWQLRDDDTDADQQAVRKLRYFNGWGWGITRRGWEEVIRPQWDWDCDSGGPNDSGYDWNMQLRVLPSTNRVSLVPDAARSQTIGEHGGTYSSPQILPFQQSRSFREHREKDWGYQLKEA